MPSSQSIRSVRLVLIFFFALASLYYMSRSYSRIPLPPSSDSFTPGGKQPTKPPSQFPVQDSGAMVSPSKVQTGKMKAAFVTLIRNSELWEIMKSIRQIEDRFNRNYHYPWVFLNDVPFTEEFIQMTSALASGKTHYGLSLLNEANVALVPKEHWSIPEWIDEEKAKKAREDMEQRNIIYGGSLPYRHMCRFQSGFFWRQPILDDFDWYWRVVSSLYGHSDVGTWNELLL